MIAQKEENKTETKEIDGSIPLKGKREKFAQELAKGDCNHTEAARRANYKDHKGLRQYVYKMTTNPIIKARISYLQAKTAEKFNITQESQTKQYIEIRARAIETGDLRAEISANNSIDKLNGLIVDKTQTVQTDAQKARTATEERVYREYSEWLMRRKLGTPEALQELNTVDIRDGHDLQTM